MGEDYNKITLIKKYLGKLILKKRKKGLFELIGGNFLFYEKLIKRELQAFTIRWNTIGF